MSFEHQSLGGLDYRQYRHGDAKVFFRGPQRERDEPHIICFGSSETYGKFIARPYPNLLEQETGMTVINMGAQSAGVDAFLAEPDLIAFANRAKTVVVQLAGAHLFSNRFYKVHPRRNDRFLGPTEVLRALFPDVEFTDISFTGHLLASLHDARPEIYHTVVTELQHTWVARMNLLLDQIGPSKVLLWMGDVAPQAKGTEVDDIRNPGGPLFVTREMIERISDDASQYVEVVASAGAKASGTRGMTFGEMEASAAAALPGPRTHEEVADALAPVLLELRGTIS